MADPRDTGPRWIEAWDEIEGERKARAVLPRSDREGAVSVASAPGRMTIIGEYTDIGGGLSLATVTPHRTWAAARVRDDHLVRIAMDPAMGEPGEPTTFEGALDELDGTRGLWLGYAAGVIWALRERGFSGPGLDVGVASCIPNHAGLSTAASLSASVAYAVNRAWGLGLPEGTDSYELADACVDVANDFVGGASAGLGQHTVMRCAEGEALVLDFGTSPPSASPCPLYFPEYGLRILAINTGSGDTDLARTIRQRIRETSAAADALSVPSLASLHGAADGAQRIESIADPVVRSRARHVFTENERVELVRDELSGTGPAHERFVAVGKAMYRSHASLESDLDVSTPELNLAVETAFRSGALGAHMVGTGHDACAVALVRRASATSTAVLIDRAFQERGLDRPTFLLM